jgi:hypothetical protein
VAFSLVATAQEALADYDRTHQELFGNRWLMSALPPKAAV